MPAVATHTFFFYFRQPNLSYLGLFWTSEFGKAFTISVRPEKDGIQLSLSAATCSVWCCLFGCTVGHKDSVNLSSEYM